MFPKLTGLARRAVDQTVGALDRHCSRVLRALGKAAIPHGAVVPAVDHYTLEAYQRIFGRVHPRARLILSIPVMALELGAIAYAGKPFSLLNERDGLAYLRVLHEGLNLQFLLRAALYPLKLVHFGRPEISEQPELHRKIVPPTHLESSPWQRKLKRLSDHEHGETVEVDAVVVGTGAGGAVVAYELANQGHAVLMIEEGRHFRRDQFTGKYEDTLVSGMMQVTPVLSNALVFLPRGKSVGGTTIINSGTFLKPPDWLLDQWSRGLGCADFSAAAMEAHFQAVHEFLGLAEARESLLGGAAQVIRAGCRALGIEEHGPALRNAPDCDGQGVCCAGCPTDAKRSTNVSYVPKALAQGAELMTEARATRLLVEGGKAAGIVVESTGPDAKSVTVRAREVILAMGAASTPVFLQKQTGIHFGKALGQGIVFHPAVNVTALMPEGRRERTGIPQSYHVTAFRDPGKGGFFFEGSRQPLDITGTELDLLGPSLTRAMDRAGRLVSFAAVLCDQPRGRVRSTRWGPVIQRRFIREDMDRLREGVYQLSRIFCAAGAEEIYTGIHGFRTMRHNDLEKLRSASLHPRGVGLLSAYHLLGGTAMGSDPETSIVRNDFETHALSHLSVVGGSIAQGSTFANPQWYLMAMARIAAKKIGARLS